MGISEVLTITSLFLKFDEMSVRKYSFVKEQRKLRKLKDVLFKYRNIKNAKVQFTCQSLSNEPNSH